MKGEPFDGVDRKSPCTYRAAVRKHNPGLLQLSKPLTCMTFKEQAGLLDQGRGKASLALALALAYFTMHY